MGEKPSCVVIDLKKVSILDYEFDNVELKEEWVLYIKAYKMGLRKESSSLLKKFLNNIKPEEKKSFAFFLCSEIFEKGNSFTLQYPIKKELIFPYLVKKFNENSMPEIRWLYQLDLAKETIEFLGIEDYSEALLQKAVKKKSKRFKNQKTFNRVLFRYS